MLHPGLLLMFLAALTLPAQAVVPGLMGPLQVMVGMLPQLFALLLGLLGSMLSLSYWRIRLRQHARLFSLLALLGLGLLGAIYWSAQDRRAPLLATATPTPLPSATRDWPSFRGDIGGGGGGNLDGTILPASPTPLWSHSDKEGSEYISSPVSVGDRIYVGGAQLRAVTLGGSVECLDARDGHTIWRSITRHTVFSSPIVVGGRVYCGEGLHEHEDSKLYCLDAATGATIFTVPTKGHTEGSPTYCENRLIFGAGGDGVYCVDPGNGKILWHTQCGHCDCSPAVGEGRVFLGTAYKSDSAVCLDLKTGKELWKVKQDLPVWGHPALRQGKVLFGLGNGTFSGSHAQPRGAVICVDASTGRQSWRMNLPDSVNTSLCVSGEDVLLGCRDGNAYCLALEDGHMRWKSLCGQPLLSSLVVQGDTVLVAGGDGWLHALDRANGARRWGTLLSLANCESSPVVGGGRLYVGAGTSLVCLGK